MRPPRRVAVPLTHLTHLTHLSNPIPHPLYQGHSNTNFSKSIQIGFCKATSCFKCAKEVLSISPHKRGMEIMQLWPPGFHTWPSLSPRIWWTTEMDGHAHSIRRQKPASVPQDVSCPQNRRSATASAARSRTTAPLDSSRSNARGESGTQSVDVWPTRLAPVCPYASGDYRGSHEWS